MGWFSKKEEPRPWERRTREQIEEDVEDIVSLRREPRVTYRVEVGTTHDTYSFESEKPILIVDAPEYVTITIDDGESGSIKFYKRNLAFIQEYVPS